MTQKSEQLLNYSILRRSLSTLLLVTSSLNIVPGARSWVFQEASGVPPITFKYAESGRLIRKDGVHVDFERFRSSDNVLLEQDIESFPSAERAEEEIRTIIERARKVIKKDVKLAASGQMIGKRAIVILDSSWRGPGPVAVIWVDKSKVYIIRSSSEMHIRTFEHQTFPSPRE